MSSLTLGGIVFLCLFGAALFGMWLKSRVPDHHLAAESKDAIRLATAIVGTLSALALGLLIASAKSTYDDAETEMRTSVGRILLLDRVMAHYGPETAKARGLLRQLVTARLDQGWGYASNDEAAADIAVGNAGIEPVQDILRALSPATDAQRWLQSRALEVSGQIAEAHWMLVDTGSESLPWAFLMVLVFWLALLFATFGLLAPGNATIVATLLVCSLSVAGAVFLIVDMAHPYLGVIYVSDAPLREALDQLGQK
jgi:hypothetical protein